ncbi:glycoside hydrolase family 19 protein [Actinokineospora auranticolor]|uniref:Chitinase n=1 Tax=Actinokineospora auranticolor TaxID=155976 RepID=A0A2S6GMF6_9PSEU|nr:glycoside hydrolase family 19 protein [Actinokineospora auranticolor]PPK66397.1 chitinase [Actinokineospora auranticolor]
MSRNRIVAAVAAAAAAAGLAFVLPSVTAEAAADCAAPWASATVYTGGKTASYNGKNWQAKWWTQGETPGGAQVWTDQGACGGGTPPTTTTTRPTTTTPPTTTLPPGGCNYAAWVQGKNYVTGDIVKFTDGKFYIAEHDNPGYSPVVSTWYWDPYTCGDTPPTSTTSTPPTSIPNTGFVVSEAQFNQMFPSRNAFYTYKGLTDALAAYPGFANTGTDTVKRQEAAAFLANVNHETGGLVYIKEINEANYPHYCDATQSYGCPAGQSAYYGRGPIQLSWNFNYKAAGDALGIDLLRNPFLVEQDPAVAWKTALWYWNTQKGPGTMTPHDAMVNSRGFGETIRSINGALECNGGNPAQVQSRINAYQKFTQVLGTTPGNNLSC